MQSTQSRVGQVASLRHRHLNVPLMWMDHTPKFQEAIAMVQESIKPFSPPFIRKTAALIDQVAELVEQLNQVAIDEGSGNLCVRRFWR